MDPDALMTEIEKVQQDLHGLNRKTMKDQRLLEPRAAYQLALLRSSIGFALQAVERASYAVSGMVPDDFKQAK